MAHEGRLEIMHIRRERLLDDGWRHELCPQAGGLLEDTGASMLDR